MEWWIWASLGIALLVGEMILPGSLFLLFFGVGALIVSAMVNTGMIVSHTAQWLWFSVLSIAFLVLFRKKLSKFFESAPTSTELGELTGEIGTVQADILAGGTGSIELRGTVWSARSVAAETLIKGSRCRVERTEGLTMLVGKAP